jgi:heme O synthase-like polyprenyltransferase
LEYAVAWLEFLDAVRVHVKVMRWRTWVQALGAAAGAVMLVPAYRLYGSLDKKDARKLMFASFIHLPVLQLAYVLDRT